MRALAVLLALVLGFGAAVMIVAGAEISDSPTVAECLDDPTVIPSDGECFDGSDTNQTIVTVLCFASGAVAALSALLALGFAISGRRGRLVVQTASLAILLAVIALII